MTDLLLMSEPHGPFPGPLWPNSSSCIFNQSMGSTENNATEECFKDQAVPPSIMAIIQVFYGLVCVLGLLGNSLVIYVVLRFEKMKTVTNMYILMLATADECFLVGIPFLIATSATGNWPFGMVMCKAYMTTTSINQFTSSIFLTVMSADRFIAVCHPISAPKYRTKSISRIVSVTAWLASALLMVPIFLYATILGKPNGGISCNIVWSSDLYMAGDKLGYLNPQTAFTAYSFAFGFAVPLVLIIIFYIMVIVKLQTVGPKNRSKEKKKSHRRVTKLVLTVITVYIFCWLPYWVTQLALIFTPPGHNNDTTMVLIMLLASCLSYSNSAMNPVLYAFLSDNFKKSFMKACWCHTGRELNNQLLVENSAFPRGKIGNSTKAQAKTRQARTDYELDGGGMGEGTSTAITNVNSKSSSRCGPSSVSGTSTGNNRNEVKMVTLNGNLAPPIIAAVV